MGDVTLDVSALLRDGWKYVDLPWMRLTVFTFIIEGMGADNHHVLAYSDRLDKPLGEGGIPQWRRGQVIVSAAGRESLAAFKEANKDRFDALFVDAFAEAPADEATRPPGDAHG